MTWHRRVMIDILSIHLYVRSQQEHISITDLLRLLPHLNRLPYLWSVSDWLNHASWGRPVAGWQPKLTDWSTYFISIISLSMLIYSVWIVNSAVIHLFYLKLLSYAPSDITNCIAGCITKAESSIYGWLAAGCPLFPGNGHLLSSFMYMFTILNEWTEIHYIETLSLSASEHHRMETVSHVLQEVHFTLRERSFHIWLNSVCSCYTDILLVMLLNIL